MHDLFHTDDFVFAEDLDRVEAEVVFTTNFGIDEMIFESS